MYINSIQKSEQAFGIKYLNKSMWDKKVLNTFENSNLLRSIDVKYPDASIKYIKFFDWESETHTLVAKINLAKDKLFSWSLSSHKEDVVKNNLIHFIDTASLDDIESKSVKAIEPIAKVNIEPKKTSISERLKRLYHRIFYRIK